ncbi:MAG TPA: mechanosensitive ion channel family protein [Clostridiales bacterium]|nr:mechanosensitive ion channel family protein [Clostridiales bacterium]
MFADFLSNYGTLIKQIAIAVLIFLAFLLLRKIFITYIFRLLLKITKRTTSDFDNQLVMSFEKPMRVLIIILGIYFALAYLPLKEAQDTLLLKFLKSSIIVAIAAGFYNMAGVSSGLFEEIEKKFNVHIDKILKPFLEKIIRAVIVVLVVTVLLQEWGYSIDGLIAGLGLGGLAISLAAKDTLANIFAGVVIITDKPFSIGDWIYTPSIEGVVEDINFRSTKVRTFAQALITVPNSTLANEPITNWSRMGKRRITFKLGLQYFTPRDKLERCIQAIETMLREHPDIHKETIFVTFEGFENHSLEIFLYFFTITTKWEEYLKVRQDVNLRIMKILEDEQVPLAFPGRSLYFETPLDTRQQPQDKPQDKT